MTDTDTVTEDVEAEPRAKCLCGCDATPKGRKARFMPGHDAQLKAALYVQVRDEELAEDIRQIARDRLDEFGWPQPAPKAARKPRNKTDEAAENAESDEVTAEDL